MTVTTKASSTGDASLTAATNAGTADSAADTERRAGVKEPLTPNRPPGATADIGARRRVRPVRRRADVENREFAAFVRRVVRAHARRIATGDVDSLTDLLDLAAEVDTATRDAVTGLRAAGHSWADIAARTGTTRQAAQQRWGR